MKARDSGLGAYLPYGSGKSQELVIGTPIYKTGVAPTTVLKRRGALLGWTGTELVPNVLLATSLRGYPNTAVKFQFNSGNIVATFRAGKAPRGAQTMSTNLHNGWRIETYAGVNNGSIFSNVNALALLLVGLALSMLLGAMLYILGTGRSRALGLVKERTSDLEHLALHDVLTGLPNRALILDRIGQMIARVRRDHTGSALLFLDLDNFKDINDTLGHTVGDQLLVEVGKRLTSILREGDTVGRLSGDEFVILAEGDSLHPDAGALGQRILDALSESFTVKDCAAALSVSASIGIAQGERNHPEDLLRDADIAMYRAKGAGKNRVVAFVPSMQEDVVVRRALGVDLQKALDNEEFFLMYQPIVDLKSGIITGAEALLRWRHPERGVIQPDQFIPALESSGLIIPVGLWVLGEACRQGFEWLERGVWLDLSVNISARQLEYDQIVDDVKNVLTLSVYPADMLTLELTETTLMADVEDSIERLRLLKSLGIRLAIDDFGTGYSSIAYLRQFPVDGIKIDRSFVSNIVETAEAASLVHTLIQLGKDLGLSTVAEGVETDAQRLKLIAEDADFAQGFLFARPLLADDIEALAKLNAMSGNGIQ
jgi:diguanylate cyclase (GGDEF)-like protein